MTKKNRPFWSSYRGFEYSEILEVHETYGGDICNICGGDGELDEWECSRHSSAILTSESQSHCAHGKTAQHD